MFKMDHLTQTLHVNWQKCLGYALLWSPLWAGGIVLASIDFGMFVSVLAGTAAVVGVIAIGAYLVTDDRGQS